MRPARLFVARDPRTALLAAPAVPGLSPERFPLSSAPLARRRAEELSRTIVPRFVYSQTLLGLPSGSTCSRMLRGQASWRSAEIAARTWPREGARPPVRGPPLRRSASSRRRAEAGDSASAARPPRCSATRHRADGAAPSAPLTRTSRSCRLPEAPALRRRAVRATGLCPRAAPTPSRRGDRPLHGP